MPSRHRTGCWRARCTSPPWPTPLEAVEQELPRLEAWGAHLAAVLGGGGRLLAAGNGRSAARAEHLAAELLGRYRTNRRPLSGLALGTEGAALTAIDNDIGPDEVFTRQVEAHGRRGDVFVASPPPGAAPTCSPRWPPPGPRA